METFLSPSTFRWSTDVTPMSSFAFLVMAEVIYFVTIYGIQYWLAQRPASSNTDVRKGGNSDVVFKLTLCTHNAILCGLSVLMFCGAAYEAWMRSRNDGIEWMFCEKPNAQVDHPMHEIRNANEARKLVKHQRSRARAQAVGGVYFWSYIYYLSKFLEFVDTVFKVVKRKPLDFLHVYHHSLVAFMCWQWLETAQSLQTLGLLFNTFVHIFMYFYFALTVYYPPPWWKKYITKLQIIQFQSSFVLAIPFVVLHLSRTSASREGCQGSHAFIMNAMFNLSLLVLFMNFSKKTYSNKKAE